MLRRHQAQIGHQLARVVEAAERADLGDQRDRVQDRDAAQRLDGLDHRRQGPARQELDHRRRDPFTEHLRPLDPLDELFQHQMLGGVFKAKIGQPAAQ